LSAGASSHIIPPCIFFVVFRGFSSRIHHLQHRHESQKSSGLIDGETLDLVKQNEWLD
jgi:hypothetical protein